MSLLKVLLDQQEIAALELRPGVSYLAGRGSDCDIILPSDKGISRHHLRIHEVDGVWTVSLLSKVGVLLVEGHPVHEVLLAKALEFQVPPFVFHYGLQSAGANALSSTSADGDPEITLTPPPEPPTETPTEEITKSSVVQLSPYVTVKNHKTHETTTFKLEGQVWVGGRSEDAELPILDSAISRRHFEISWENDQFVVRDLGSSNGFRINGRAANPEEPHPLASGDTLQIRHIDILFELRDDQFQQRFGELAVLPQAVSEESPNTMINMNVERIDARHLPQVESSGSKKTWFAVAGVAVLALVFALSNTEQKTSLPSESDSAHGTVAVPNSQTMNEARHLFELAKNYYRTGNYEFCINQIEKLHKLTPSYENSKEIETYCHQAIELQRISADRERSQREKQVVENQIDQVLDSCQRMAVSRPGSQRMRECLAPALELSPDNPKAMELILNAESREAQERQVALRNAEVTLRKGEGQSVFEKAQDLEKKGQKLKAITAYRNFLNATYDLPNQNTEARISIERIEGEMESQAQTHAKLCDQAFQENRFRDAILECRKALNIRPTLEAAKQRIPAAEQKMRTEFKKLYESAILEESYGNVEAAKEKWREIMAASLPGEDYFEKSKSKMGKYSE
jgi:pSer/pThr/pTyr-binding forkhead associated (FHA) protein